MEDKIAEIISMLHSLNEKKMEECEDECEVKCPKKEVRGGKSEKLAMWRMFLKKLKERKFMREYKGKTGKREVQSVLYELKKDLKDAGFKSDVFNGFLDKLETLHDDEETRRSTRKMVLDNVKLFRGMVDWPV